MLDTLKIFMVNIVCAPGLLAFTLSANQHPLDERLFMYAILQWGIWGVSFLVIKCGPLDALGFEFPTDPIKRFSKRIWTNYIKGDILGIDERSE